MLGIAPSALFAQTESPATIPASFVGTYDLVFESFNSASPIETNTPYTLVIGADGSLCVNGIQLTDPVLLNGNPAEAIWKDAASSLWYAISDL